LCAEVFPWAAFRRTKGAVKLHLTLDHDGYLPTAVVITEGKDHGKPANLRDQRTRPAIKIDNRICKTSIPGSNLGMALPAGCQAGAVDAAARNGTRSRGHARVSGGCT
jgi:hypothetical protein